MTDLIDRAIETSEAAPDQGSTQPNLEGYAQASLKLVTTGRAIYLLVPIDLTEGETLDLMGWEGAMLQKFLAGERMKRGGLVLATTIPTSAEALLPDARRRDRGG